MKMTVLYLTISTLCFSSCSHSTVNQTDTLPYKEIVLENFYRDTCIVFKNDAGDTISFNRNFELLENTCGDTLNVGINYVEPNQKGEYFNYQVDTLNVAIDNSEEYKEYIERTDSPELYTKYLCIYNLSIRWHGHSSGKPGRIRVRVYYKPEKSGTMPEKY
jgi:hypothetical protein